jgi:hypothetical protein
MRQLASGMVKICLRNERPLIPNRWPAGYARSARRLSKESDAAG